MGLFLLRFWPALLPLLAYIMWYWLAARSAIRQGKPKPNFCGTPLYWAVLASLLIAMLCFFYLDVQIEPQKGEYTPPQWKGGQLVPGHVER